MPRPAVTFNPKTGCWTLLVDFETELGAGTVRIPAGFRFDLASVPRPLWSVVTPYGLSITAPLVHDWLYQRGGCVEGEKWVCLTRREADGHFLQLMRQEGVNGLVAALAWCVVRVFGWVWWRPRLQESFAKTGEPVPATTVRTPTMHLRGRVKFPTDGMEREFRARDPLE